MKQMSRRKRRGKNLDVRNTNQIRDIFSILASAILPVKEENARDILKMFLTSTATCYELTSKF